MRLRIAGQRAVVNIYSHNRKSPIVFPSGENALVSKELCETVSSQALSQQVSPKRAACWMAVHARSAFPVELVAISVALFHARRSAHVAGHIKVGVEMSHFEIQASKMPAVHCAEAEDDKDGDELSHRGVAIRVGLVERVPSEAAATFRLVVNTVDELRGPRKTEALYSFSPLGVADRGSTEKI